MPSDNLLLTIFPSHLYGARRHLAELWIERKMLVSLASQVESLNEIYEKCLKTRVQNHCHRKTMILWQKRSTVHKNVGHMSTTDRKALSFCSNQQYLAFRLDDICIDHLFPDPTLSQIGHGTWALLICFERCDCPSYPAGLSHLPRHWGIEISVVHLLWTFWLPSVKPSVRSKTLFAAAFSESTPKFVFFLPNPLVTFIVIIWNRD